MIFKNTVLTALLLVTTALAVEAAPRKRAQFRGMTTSVETVQDLIDLRATGANIAGYQINLNGGSTDNVDLNTYALFLTQKLDQLQTFLDTCNTIGLKVLLVLGTPPGGFSSRAIPAQHRYFVEQASHDAMITSWQAIATRFKGHPAIYGYDLQNEPAQRSVGAGLEDWRSLSRTLLATVRAIDPNVRICVEPIYGNADKLSKLGKIDDNNLEYCVHPYFPSSVRNAGLNGRPINVKYPTKRLNKRALAKSLAGARRFQKKFKVDIFAAEFAAPRWLPAAAKFLKDYYSIFEGYGWNWAQHAWREADVWSIEHTSDFNNPNPSPVETDRAAAIKKFFQRN